jgi:hydrogenase-4 component B
VIVLTANVFLHDKLWGNAVLAIGCITMFVGALLAIFSVDLKRTLACSSMSQIGFILVGIAAATVLGEHNGYAAAGTVLHMLNHSMLKLLLFLGAGAVFCNLHKLDLNAIRGFGRGKPLLTAVFFIGAVGLGGVPGFNGYLSKTLLHEALLECAEFLPHGLVIGSEWLFLLSGGCTAAYMTKLFVALCIEKNRDAEKQAAFAAKKRYLTPVSAVVLGGTALVVIALGVLPVARALAEETMAFAGGSHAGEWHLFSLEALKGAAISLGIGTVLYFGVIRLLLMKNGEYVDRIPTWLDLEDRIYRPLLNVLAVIGAVIGRIFGDALDACAYALRRTLMREVPVKEAVYRGG